MAQKVAEYIWESMRKSPMSLQTRNGCGELAHHSSLQEAFQAWKSDSTIWKISYVSDGGEPHRWIHDEDNGVWKDEPLVPSVDENFVVSFPEAKRVLNEVEFCDFVQRQ